MPSLDNGLGSNILARRASRSRPIDTHFWGKYIQNSPNLLKNLHLKHAPWMANFQFLAKSLLNRKGERGLEGYNTVHWPFIVHYL